MEYNQDVRGSLLRAVREGQLTSVRELINSFGLCYSQDWPDGYSLLCVALANKHAAVAKLLLESGVGVNRGNLNTNTPLHFAVVNGDLEMVKMLLDKGSNVEAKNGFGKTPLHYAIISRKIEVIKLLLKHGPDVNCVCSSTREKGYTALHFAAENNCKGVTGLLSSSGAYIDVKAADGETPLHIGAKNGHIHIAEDLLSHGADINATTKDNLTPLLIATTTGHETVVRLLLQRGAKVDVQDKDGKTTLHIAAQKGHLMIVEDVLKYSPDINNQGNRNSLKAAVNCYGTRCKEIVEALLEYGFTINPKDANDPQLLHAAVKKGYLKIVLGLLKCGANVNTSIYQGFTPLHRAVMFKQENVAKILISFKANINAQDNVGDTPIFYAVKNGDLKIAKLLLRKGANVNAKQKYGTTALHIASQKGHIDLVKVLLECGANVDVNANCQEIEGGCNILSGVQQGRTALHIACQKEHLIIVETLLDYGSDINITSGDNRTPSEFITFKHSTTNEVLKRHIVKMKTANLYVSEENLRSVMLNCITGQLIRFQKKCEVEILHMKSEKINKTNISFYDILTKSTNSLAICMRNKDAVQVLKANNYEKKFPIYASMIKSYIRKNLQRKELLEQANTISHFLFNNFPELPYDCTEKIYGYLSDEDLRILMNAFVAQH